MTTKIKILVLAANPVNTSQLRLGEEVRSIQAALKQAEYRDRFELISQWAVRAGDLSQALLDHKPQFVHFSGHGQGYPTGTVDRSAAAPSRDIGLESESSTSVYEGLVLEDDQGKAKLVSTAALAGLFELFQNEVKCVVLNACYSETQANAIHQHIDCVVGMNKAIGDRAAIQFATEFYKSLATGRSFAFAHQFARNSLDLNNIPESLTPVLQNRRGSDDPFKIISSHSDASLEKSMHPVPPSNRNNSISIGGSVTGSAITSGDNNKVSVTFQPASLPAPASVDIQAEIEALRAVLATLSSPDRKKIDNALEEIEDELKKPQPDKDEVGKALDRAMNYAQKANGFAEAIDKLRPHVEKTAAWLGEYWYKLLPLVHLAL